MNALRLSSLNGDGNKRTVVAVDGVRVGEDFVVIAGPCSVESEEQTLTTARKVKEAGAAKMVAEQRPKGAAAIAGELSAKLYGLEIIKENIADLERNITRFLVLTKTGNKEEGKKCSIIFATEHKAGTLFRVLEVFAKKNINLTRIESMPHEPGNYAFFVDFEGSDKERRVTEALDKVKEITSTFKMMGCYNERNGE